MRMRPTVLLLVALTLGTMVVSGAAEAQQVRRPYRIGVLHTGFFEEIPSVAGLKAGLKVLGLEEGRDVTFDIRFTRGKLEEVPTVAAALVSTGSDLVVAREDHSARGLKAATSKIPVVFVEVGDPLASDLVAWSCVPAETSPGYTALPRS
jgi:putative ABC transport system substrate-binding protein